MNFAPGSNIIRILPPKGQKWDYPHFRLVPEDVKTFIRHDAERWKTCPMCVREAVTGIVAFIQWVNSLASGIEV